LLGSYPDVFKAGSASADVPFGCFAGPTTWNSDCADGKISKTGKEWGDMVRAAYPGYSGPRPRVQLWHGEKDVTLNYKNFDEDIKQWVDVLGLNPTPVTSQFVLKLGSTYTYSRSCYANSSNIVMLDAIKALNQDHNCKISEDSVITFFGLDKATPLRNDAMENLNLLSGPALTMEKASFGIYRFIVSSKPGRVTVDLYDLKGRKIQTIADQNSAKGHLKFSWNGKAASGRALPSAVYFVAVKVNGTAIGRQTAAVVY
jgi:hypothetical protein